jgi:hypothetical protein
MRWLNDKLDEVARRCYSFGERLGERLGDWLWRGVR